MEQRAFSIRAAAKIYGLGRVRLGQAVRDGEIPGRKIGARRTLVLAEDIERWIRGQAIRPTAFAERRVAKRLEAEARRQA